jgi:hypothetical protein
VRLAVLVVLGACGALTPQPARPTTGSIAGLARDRDSGDPIAKAAIVVQAQGSMKRIATVSDGTGGYHIDKLPPGRYSLEARFAGQPVDVANIDVRAGDEAVVDLTFTLGAPDPVHVDFGDARQGAIDRYRPKHLAPTVAIIEGTVTDSATHDRIAGAVVTVVRPPNTAAEQTSSDDQGRYHFDNLPPGTYTVSAYYSIAGRGQIEVRRSDISVNAAEAVVVPLWVEVARP